MPVRYVSRRDFVKILGSTTMSLSLYEPTGMWGANLSPLDGTTGSFIQLSIFDIASRFPTPQEEARPWVYWFWINGNVTREGIKADLEAMQRVGIGGVLIMEVARPSNNEGAPPGPLYFMSPKWQEMFEYACSEAQRLGLEVNMNNDAGWCGSGGPWITPDLSMQQVVWSETRVSGGQRVEQLLQRPLSNLDYYNDIAVLAFPTPVAEESGHGYRIADFRGLSEAELMSRPPSEDGAKDNPPTMADWPKVPMDQCVTYDQIVNISNRMDQEGRLVWDTPAGDWTILRFGHTTRGIENHPAPLGGLGLESDRLSRKATEMQFNSLIGQLVKDLGPLAGGKALASTHIDSWENGTQNWTPTFREDFKRLRGYDAQAYLPIVTGRVVESLEISQRFLWDFRQTISDLLVQNYAAYMRDLAARHGLRLSIEGYSGVPANEMDYAGQAIEPMAEIWSWERYDSWPTVVEMASAGHTYGHRIIGQETFTASDSENFQGHPAVVKDIGDWAFCNGINRFVIHRYAMQPWTNPHYVPGMSMGDWGLHYERTQTWWEMSRPWHEYLTRCSFLLRQGHFVADICYLQPEGAPRDLSVPVDLLFHPETPIYPPDRPGYNFDVCSADVVLTRMSVKDGRLMLPDGMSYRVLVLPATSTMTPELLQKIKELIDAGATVIGDKRPLASPSLENYPHCDLLVQQLAAELWDSGKVIQGISPNQVLANLGIPLDFRSSVPLNFCHRQINDADVYFVANRSTIPVAATCEFRVAGRRPEFWNPETGAMELAVAFETDKQTTHVPVSLEQQGSTFVVFRRNAPNADPIVRIERNGRPIISGAWKSRVPRIVLKKATYGPPHDTKRTRDVTMIVQKLVDKGQWSFPVAEIATILNSDTLPDLAGILHVQYVIDGQLKEASALYGREFTFAGSFASAIPVISLAAVRDAKEIALVSERGRYVLTCASGKTHLIEAHSVPQPMEITGPWRVLFPSGWGAPSSITLEKLISWSDHPVAGVRYFSGTAAYETSFEMSPSTEAPQSAHSRYFLDLGTVAVMAQVKLNNKELGILWKPPFVLDVTDALVAGKNKLIIQVVNLWINRLIGDQNLPEDCKRTPDGSLLQWPQWLLEDKPSPTGRLTFSTWQLWKKNDPLTLSGLIGPVQLLTARTAVIE